MLHVTYILEGKRTLITRLSAPQRVLTARHHCTAFRITMQALMLEHLYIPEDHHWR